MEDQSQAARFGGREFGILLQVRCQRTELPISVTSWLDLHVGREIERWGTGYAFNPTGVVNPPKDPTDRTIDAALPRRGCGGRRPLRQRLGRHSSGHPQISWAGKDGRHLLATGWASRAYRLIKGTDVAVSASGGSGLPQSEGLSLARVFGNSLELHGEAAYLSIRSVICRARITSCRCGSPILRFCSAANTHSPAT